MADPIEIQVTCDECHAMFDSVYDPDGGESTVDCPSCGEKVKIDPLEIICA